MNRQHESTMLSGREYKVFFALRLCFIVANGEHVLHFFLSSFPVVFFCLSQASLHLPHYTCLLLRREREHETGMGCGGVYEGVKDIVRSADWQTDSSLCSDTHACTTHLVTHWQRSLHDLAHLDFWPLLCPLLFPLSCYLIKNRTLNGKKKSFFSFFSPSLNTAMPHVYTGTHYTGNTPLPFFLLISLYQAAVVWWCVLGKRMKWICTCCSSSGINLSPKMCLSLCFSATKRSCVLCVQSDMHYESVITSPPPH